MLYEKIDELEDAENHQAEPEIHQRAEVELKSLVSRRRRQVRHDDKIKGVADEDDDQIPQPTSRGQIHNCAVAPAQANALGEELFAAREVPRLWSVPSII
jgi:hypothetical protein